MPDDHWNRERRLWTGGVPDYLRLMDDLCLMALPEKGILAPGPILAAVETAPRWSAVSFEERTVSETDGMAILGYIARAERGTGDYRALCTSVWLRRVDGWRIVQHQQSPI
ncbi:MAG: DUF4440 domain-containing protein [Paracoccaceae bacterium]